MEKVSVWASPEVEQAEWSGVCSDRWGSSVNAALIVNPGRTHNLVGLIALSKEMALNVPLMTWDQEGAHLNMEMDVFCLLPLRHYRKGTVQQRAEEDERGDGERTLNVPLAECTWKQLRGYRLQPSSPPCNLTPPILRTLMAMPLCGWAGADKAPFS